MLMSLPSNSHGTILCGSIVVSDLDKSTRLYCEKLDYEVIERGQVSGDLANSWSASAFVDQDYCLLQPAEYAPNSVNDGDVSYLRLLQSPDDTPPYPHATTFGWCAFEISVKDVFALEKKINKSVLKESMFDVVGPPKRLDNIDNVIPMQVVGPDQEVLFLNQVLASDEHSDLPMARYQVDQFFIAVLAAQDRSASVAQICNQLKLSETMTLSLRYGLINRAFELDTETQHSLSLLQNNRRPVIEVDQYPELANARQAPDNSLSKGNAIVSILVDSLEGLPSDLRLNAVPLAGVNGALYQNRKTVVISGRNGELIELIERDN